jgi:hypothetical protein
VQRVIIVHLRRPRSRTENPEEMRSDPFWEFGSFGITRCHDKNLMHRRNAKEVNGVRFAFAQGGKQGTRLVHLTPPVKIVEHLGCIEATWSPHAMPFRYSDAPILARNGHESHFPQLKSCLKADMKAGGRPTLEGQFSSNFRSRATCLEASLAEELIHVYTELRKMASRSEIATCYMDALPWSPPHPDNDRDRTYEKWLSEARGSNSGYRCGSRKSCSPKKRRKS